MATKSKRIEVRIDEDVLAHIQRAAGIAQEPVSDFVRKAAYSRAEEMLRDNLITVMPAEQFDAMMATLDEPDDAPRLMEAARKRQVWRRV